MANASDERLLFSPTEQREMLISREELVNCSLPLWYEQFKSITFKSVFIPLPDDFIDYLNSDGCILPLGCELPSLAVEHTDSDSESDQEDWTESDNEDAEEQAPSFPKLIEEIKAALEQLGDAVFPKLNWSSPRDAVWITPGHTLRCHTPAEIILLLKSSDFVAHDLSRVGEYCKVEPAHESTHPLKYTLCLRRWHNILPSMEFRCFVCNNCLIAICQRNNSTFYKYLQENKGRIRREIVDFYQQEIAGKFTNKNYVVDILRTGEDQFLLVDFNPYCPMSDPLLFSWEELTATSTSETFASHEDSLISEHPVFRLVDGVSIQPSDLQSLQLPQDIVDITSGEDIHKLVDLIKAKTEEQAAE